jgi:hypothetical protein
VPPEPKAKGGVATTRDNVVELRPFQVSNVKCTDPWDPTDRVLEVSYDINDPNHRIRAGRIVYEAPVNDRRVPVHIHKLKPAQLTHGCNELPLLDRWDGKIDKGLVDRIGTRVTADLSEILVRVEVWNNANDAPGAYKEGGDGRTSLAGEWLSMASARVRILAIVKATWDTHWAIPYGDPDEPAKGKAGMNITVKNVLEGTPARVIVKRINEIADPNSDFPYADDKSKDQPGLKCVVKGDKVLLADGPKPYVRFLNYDEHWAHAGNNFYAFYVAFGDSGAAMAASERDYEGSEKACLHMRFTVFIHRPAGDLPDYTVAAQQLHQFFRGGTKYYRSYLMTGAPKSNRDWFEHFKYRYIVLVLGHASCGCRHPDHPTRTVGKGKKKREEKIDPYHCGFVPDRNVCPKELEKTKEAKASIKEAEAYYHQKFAGCGNRSHVGHTNLLGRSGKTKWVFGDPRVPLKDTTLGLIYQLNPPVTNSLVLSGRVPRMFFWNGGCRTILTTNMGEQFTDQEVGTGYYHGWQYSPGCDYGKMCCDFFSSWIKGSKKDKAPNEYDTSRIEKAYRDAAAIGTRPKYHPRIMNFTGVLNPREEPGSKEEGSK